METLLPTVCSHQKPQKLMKNRKNETQDRKAWITVKSRKKMLEKRLQKMFLTVGQIKSIDWRKNRWMRHRRQEKQPKQDRETPQGKLRSCLLRKLHGKRARK